MDAGMGFAGSGKVGYSTPWLRCGNVVNEGPFTADDAKVRASTRGASMSKSPAPPS